MKKSIVFYRLLSLIVLFVIGSHHAMAQERRTVTGTVTDSTGVPLAGISVAAKGGKVLGITNESGAFNVKLLPNQTTLVFSGIGYNDAEASATNSPVTVALKARANEQNEVVVTALGITKEKRALGFSVTEVKGGDLSKTNEINPINALQGKVAGVSIDEGAGGLFGSTKILIRGNSTLGNNNQPIFVVDGVIMDNDVFNGSGRDFGNDLKNLNMEDFESVSVLKGGAAAALYGIRAINGVVLITTKKGAKRNG
ncbi:MAG: TonB-dependent receptor plug domain-containing protein, partial [Chitinophagaceae bacterium]|nr:TonB-dependent receptor plug domain-containing protein [Chitinophagaceae bacterium]